jgi:hypothetical protein
MLAEAPISLGMQRHRRQRTHSEIVENENLESFGLGQSKNGCSRACLGKVQPLAGFQNSHS